MSNTHTTQLSQAGVSIWLDDLSRERLSSDSLRELVATRNVVGVTTNPAIFAKAISSGHGYAEKIERCALQGMTADETITALTCEDVADACDVLFDVFSRTQGRDGWVSIEVDPALAHDSEATVRAAQMLHARIDRPNVMIKIPATEAGVQAVTETLSLGISVNVTLIFSVSQYRAVFNAHQTGLELARVAGHDLSKIHSVASVFVSRLDTAVNTYLNEHPPAVVLTKNQAGIANARLAYEIYEQQSQSIRSEMLRAAGAPPQRLLWASTGVKDPTLEPTFYVAELALPDTVNTLPAATLDAVADHLTVPPVDKLMKYREADLVLNELAYNGVEYDHITRELSVQGLQQFVTAWNELNQLVKVSLRKYTNGEF